MKLHEFYHKYASVPLSKRSIMHKGENLNRIYESLVYLSQTLEFAAEKFKQALEDKNEDEIKKWENILRLENDYRLERRKREREHRQHLLRIALKKSYIL